LDFLSGSEEQEAFCSKLGVLLDKEETGRVRFDRLFGFLSNALDNVDRSPQSPSALTLEQECFTHLESQLSRAFGRMVSNRLSRPRADPSRSARSASPGSGQTNGGQPVARTPSPARSASSTLAAPRSQPRTARQEKATALDRCHLLYHQAVFASREGAQLEEEIKLLKEREEMRECTFHPKLLPAKTRRPASPKPQVRNFESTVARMKDAHNKQLAREQERQRVPCGENYERLRRLGAQPFSCAFKERRPRRQPLVYVDVNVGRGRTGRIGVHEGDDLRVLSKNFAKAFQLDKVAEQRLEELLRQAYDDQVEGKAEPEEGYVPSEEPVHGH